MKSFVIFMNIMFANKKIQYFLKMITMREMLIFGDLDIQCMIGMIKNRQYIMEERLT